MGRTKNNKEKAEKIGYDLTLKQLKKWKINFHKLIFGKPSYDLLVDDKAYNYSDDWIKNIDSP